MFRVVQCEVVVAVECFVNNYTLDDEFSREQRISLQNKSIL